MLLDQIGVPHLKHLLETVVIDTRSGVIAVGSGGRTTTKTRGIRGASAETATERTREAKIDVRRLFRLGKSPAQ